MKLTRPRFVSALIASGLLLAGTSSAAAQPGDDPPGQQGRVTHQTLLETVESDCYEIPVARAVRMDAARALVPERYDLFVVTATAARLAMWDLVCNDFSVDGQRHAPTTQISMAGIALAARDGVAVTDSFYLLYINTDNPVLAARFRQLGLPARFEPGLISSVSDPSSTPYRVRFEDPDGNDYWVQAEAATAPSPVPVPPGSPLRLYHEGEAGEVVYTIAGGENAAVPAKIWADYREHPLLKSIIAQQANLQLNGTTTFTRGINRGSWTGTVTHLS
jgi:hypothetical protein